MQRIERVSADCTDACLPSLAARGCIEPPPVPKQCTFRYEVALALCLNWSGCVALNCNSLLGNCQARGSRFRLGHSFGDAHAYVRPGRRRALGGPRGDEAAAYRRRFENDYFLYDALYIHRTFFRRARGGFFVESGALDGSVHGSNTYYYERYLGWSGLLVEAAPANCARLAHRRSETPRVTTACTALCAFTGVANFSAAGGCCGATGRGAATVQCTRTRDAFRAHGVTRIDFWSLDVEGGELEVLKGMQWSIPVHVLLIESVTPPVRRLLTRHGFTQHAFRSPSRLNEIWINPENRGL